MKLIRFGEAGQEKPGILLKNHRYSLSEYISDYNESFFENDGVQKLQDIVAKNGENLPVVDPDARLGCPVGRPSKIICIGLNYADHARETGAAVPSEPIVFFKSTSAIIGPYDQVMIPKHSKKSDWEVELAVVMGKRASYVNEDEAMDYVAGYCLHNDLSEREFQLERNGQWVKGKSCDTFAPIGPFLATKDEIENVDALDVWLMLNGRQMQKSNTSNLIFKIPFLVSYLSQFMSLLPGDIISTGTPAGVGLGFNPQVYLKPGDVMELGIEGLGSSKQTTIAYAG